MAKLERRLEALPEPFKSKIQASLQEIRVDLRSLDEGMYEESSRSGWIRKPENDPEALFEGEKK